MVWNWQLPDWPHFQYDSSSLTPLEKKFYQGAGGVFAILKHLDEEKKRHFIVDILSIEGEKSAEIEGELLQRESLQSSIKRQFGLAHDEKRIPPKEQGMGALMWTMYDTFDEPLSHEMLHEWHYLLMSHDHTLASVGNYRTHKEPMQIVSSRYDRQTIYFEAPPSSQVDQEMSRYIDWFNQSRNQESTLARAGSAHAYFESIHPFEDGNGRIGRALVEKALSQSLGQASLLAISQEISRRKKEYYTALGTCNRTLEIGTWLLFFANVIVHAQEESLALINFLLDKSKLLNSLKGKINSRQEKVLLRMFAEGRKGFTGGLSAKNYIAITKTTRATATRDLNDLVEKGALYKIGTLKHTRYWLNIHPS
ncbi:MAG: Adenosine monophosphate-protein transferase SoFic [Chlamydiae bacterium]|nr:Adenosine monophosphate-protein transferase SoFic [Chlamydiota bacterium]